MKTTIDTMKQARSALENHNGNYKLTDAECVVHEAAIADLSAAIDREEAQTVEPACPSCNAPGLMFECIACGCNNYPPKSEQAVCTDFDAPSPAVKQPSSTERDTKTLAGWVNELRLLGEHPKGMDGWLRGAIRTISRNLADMLAADAQEIAVYAQSYDELSAAYLKAQQVAVPQGKATPAMYVAGGAILTKRIKEIQATGRSIFLSDEAIARTVFEAMLAAAPQPSQPPQAERVPMTEAEKLTLVTNWFAEEWAIKKALGLLDDYETDCGIKPQGATP